MWSLHNGPELSFTLCIVLTVWKHQGISKCFRFTWKSCFGLLHSCCLMKIILSLSFSRTLAHLHFSLPPYLTAPSYGVMLQDVSMVTAPWQPRHTWTTEAASSFKAFNSLGLCFSHSSPTCVCVCVYGWLWSNYVFFALLSGRPVDRKYLVVARSTGGNKASSSALSKRPHDVSLLNTENYVEHHSNTKLCWSA